MSEEKLKENSVEQLVQQEYLNTIKKTGDKYHSLYEGYAMLLGRVEEVKQQFEMLSNTGMDILWNSIKTEDFDSIKLEMPAMLNNAYSIIKEAILVGVAIKKIQNTVGDIKLPEDESVRTELVINIPEEFEEHYSMDHFEDSFKRIEADIKKRIGTGTLSGLYELELIEMLRKAFSKVN